MKFKNLCFTKHPNTSDGIMAQAICDNGKRISVVSGKGMYSSGKNGNRESVTSLEEASSFEVMIGSDEPLGWQSKEDIDKLLKDNS